MDDMIKKIQSMTLSKTDRVIAEYILEHLNTVGFQTSTTLAQDIGVSDTSIIRFIRKLGFKGYADFRQEMNARIARQYNEVQKELSPGQKYAITREALNQDSLIQDAGSSTIENLQKSYAKLDAATISQIADIILSSNRKYVAAFRGTACCAHYMASKLVYLTPNVISLTHADASSVEKILDITADDCLILYSFPRYSEIHYILMDIARERGAKIILITDQVTSPLSNKADIVITAYVLGIGFTNSYVVPISLSEMILLAISSREDDTRNQRIQKLDEVIGKHKLY